ncbi:MAG: hypothetical protein HKN43_03070 [Rhodothermales bacterium]|nr:hypothetical protein [Rhodothermales bacterium]
MRLIAFILCVLAGACVDTDRSFPPDVDYSEGPVVTMASTTHLAIINESLADGLSVEKAHAVRSESHEFAHYIAARIVGLEDNQSIGLWFMYDGMDVPGDAFSVNGSAREYSRFPAMDDDAIAGNEFPHEVEVLFDLVNRLP